MINFSLFFLRQCKSLDWSDRLVVLLLSATHFRKSGHARLNQGVFLIFTVFSGRRFLFSLPAPSPLPLTRPITSSLREVSTCRFREQIERSKKTPALQATSSPNYNVWFENDSAFSSYPGPDSNRFTRVTQLSRISQEATGYPSSKYEHRRTSTLCLGKNLSFL